MELAGPLGTPLGLAQRKRASPRGEAGTSGFLSISDSDHRVPTELGQESHASSCLRKGTPLACRVVSGSQAPRRAVCGTRGSFRMMHGVVSAPSCCAFTHRVAFEEGSGPRVLLKSGPGNRGRSAVEPPTWLVSNFPVRPASSSGAPGRPGTPSEPRRGIDSPVVIRRGERAQMKLCRDSRCSLEGTRRVGELLVVARRVSGTVSHFRAEHGTSPETL